MSLGRFTYLLILLAVLSPFAGLSQTCDCPAAATCNVCSGGITSFTLQFKGATAALVTVKDNSSTIFSQTLNPGDQFTLNGPPPNEKFNGNSLDLLINGVLNVVIDVNCTLVFDPNASYGSFKIISAKSKTGGQLCCTSNSGDTKAPVITDCPADIEVTTSDTECFAIVDWTAPTATDCSLNTFTSTKAPGDQFPVGETIVTYTATDLNNNQSTCSFKVKVNDAPPTVVTCRPDIVIYATNCVEKVTWTPPTFADNCGAATVTSNYTSGGFFPIDTTEVVYTATDAGGKQIQCKFNVIVQDISPPVPTGCPGNITFVADQDCQYNVTWVPPVFTDNCGVTVTSTHNPGDAFPMGRTEVTYTAKDPAGNTNVCIFAVNVIDDIPPVISNCPDNMEITVTNSSGETVVDWVPPIATDNCTVSSFTASNEPGEIFKEGITEVHYSATDNFNHTTLAMFTVTVIVEKLSLEIGGIITPDGNGVNDQWLIGNIENYEKNNVVIVDRWGSVVFSTKGYDNTGRVWDGRNTQGNMLPTGTYFYTLSVQMGNSMVDKKGFIELIR